MKKIEVFSIKFDGIERQIKFRLVNGPEQIRYAHYLHPSVYIDTGIYHYSPAKNISVEFLIEFVLEVSTVNNDVPKMIIHEIDDSTHVHCVGIIVEVIDEFTFICNLGDFGNIKVVMEDKCIELAKEMGVEFNGDLSVEFDPFILF